MRETAHLDRQLEQKPSTSTVASSGIICFINNKTPEYLDIITPEEKHNMIARVIQEVKKRKDAYKEKKAKIKEERMRQMKEKT